MLYNDIYDSKSIQWPTGRKMFLMTVALSKLLSLSWSVAHIYIVVLYSLLFYPVLLFCFMKLSGNPRFSPSGGLKAVVDLGCGSV